MILYAGVFGVNFGMHNSKLSFKLYFKKCYFSVNIVSVLFQVEKNCYTATCPIRLNPELCLSMFYPVKLYCASYKNSFNNMKALGKVTGIGSKFVHWVHLWPSNVNIRNVHYIMDSL